jgi:hypothetical protein
MKATGSGYSFAHGILPIQIIQENLILQTQPRYVGTPTRLPRNETQDSPSSRRRLGSGQSPTPERRGQNGEQVTATDRNRRLWFASFVEAARRRSSDGVWLDLISTVLGMAQVLHATLNHTSVNLGIPIVSLQRAVGITHRNFYFIQSAACFRFKQQCRNYRCRW